MALGRGSMAHFRLAPGGVSRAVRHVSVEELWYFVAGRGRMWRKDDGGELVVEVHPGMSLDIPVGTAFQFRADGDEPLEAVGVTMPPWPGPQSDFRRRRLAADGVSPRAVDPRAPRPDERRRRPDRRFPADLELVRL